MYPSAKECISTAHLHVCVPFRRVASSPVLWAELCKRTGKLKDDVSTSSEEPTMDSDFYFRLYHRVPCVPVDFATIRQALDTASPGTTITVQPGIYEERLVIQNSVRIRAADPKRGAAIVWYHRCENDSEGSNEDSSTCKCGWRKNESVVEVEESCTYVSLQNLVLLHYAEGTDLWHGNSAVYCHGDLTHTHFDGCSIQSDSGRGIVISNGAQVIVTRSTIHDCAATGIYLGGDESSLDIITSNILRNGFGRNDNDERPRTPTVQAGHSGLYIEAANAEIRNTLVAENCLTGLSVVPTLTPSRQRQTSQPQHIHLVHNTFVGNGAEPVVIFQEEGFDDDDDDPSEGAIYEHSNIFDYATPSRDEMEATLIRSPHVPHQQMSKKMLLDFYRPGESSCHLSSL
jgi:hypothetical protein